MWQISRASDKNTKKEWEKFFKFSKIFYNFNESLQWAPLAGRGSGEGCRSPPNQRKDFKVLLWNGKKNYLFFRKIATIFSTFHCFFSIENKIYNDFSISFYKSCVNFRVFREYAKEFL